MEVKYMAIKKLSHPFSDITCNNTFMGVGVANLHYVFSDKNGEIFSVTEATFMLAFKKFLEWYKQNRKSDFEKRLNIKSK